MKMKNKLIKIFPDFKFYIENDLNNDFAIKLVNKIDEANEFIKEIAKLLGDDNAGQDGISLSIGDFEELIKNIKEG